MKFASEQKRSFVTPADRAEAVRLQNQVIRGKGMAHNFSVVKSFPKKGRQKRQDADH